MKGEYLGRPRPRSRGLFDAIAIEPGVQRFAFLAGEQVGAGELQRFNELVDVTIR
ncbi:MAG TPA: hypothetical protein VKU01_23950 [Bryobacteraceae bacterium]|nr:hypothetical protein [Bryobacteraceae bacterium]